MNVILILLFIILLWFVFISFQKKQRYPIADKILNEKISDLAKNFDELASKIDKGYFYENTVINGVTYYFGYHVSRPNETTNRGLPGELVDALTIEGYVDCVTLLPFIYCKIGPSHRETIEKRLEINHG